MRQIGKNNIILLSRQSGKSHLIMEKSLKDYQRYILRIEIRKRFIEKLFNI
jgi:hypothetical protein